MRHIHLYNLLSRPHPSETCQWLFCFQPYDCWGCPAVLLNQTSRPPHMSLGIHIYSHSKCTLICAWTCGYHFCQRMTCHTQMSTIWQYVQSTSLQLLYCYRRNNCKASIETFCSLLDLCLSQSYSLPDNLHTNKENWQTWKSCGIHLKIN